MHPNARFSSDNYFGFLIAGIYVGDESICALGRETAKDTLVNVATPLNSTAHGTVHSVAYTLGAGTVTVAAADCPPGSWLWLSGDASDCFLYGPAGLPAPPVFITCPPQ
jgi:hypothetical protein